MRKGKTMRSLRHLLIVVLLCTPTLAEEPVHFESSVLKGLVEQQLGVTNPTPTDMLLLEELRGLDGDNVVNHVPSLVGLEYAKNLRVLSLNNSQVASVLPLKNLAKLEMLELRNALISDVSPLSGLPSLARLDLSGNPIAEFTAANLPKLTYLSLRGTQIKQISRLSGLTTLTELWLTSTAIADLTPLRGLSKSLCPGR